MMAQQQRLIQPPLAGALVLGLLVGVCLVVWRWFMQAEQPESVAKHTVDTPPEDALKYWTAEKMRKARPAPMPHVNAPEQKKQPPRRPPHESDPRKSE